VSGSESDDRYERGLEVRKRVVGAENVERQLRNGVTVDELRETLVQIAVYAGVPAGMEAFRIARRVLGEQVPGD
jgi:alkylhydroperoxidase/carboxymuconolactone decarboxylase family protein YurZ